MGKSQIIKKIHKAAIMYKEYFIGNTFLYVFENQYIEVIFKKSSFLHLTGVKTNLNAEGFYDHAVKKNGLRPQEVHFDKEHHPFDLADKKTSHLPELFTITTREVVIATDVITQSYTYSLGLANSDFVVCLGDNADSNGKVLNEYKVPYSLRVENIKDFKIQKRKEIFAVTHIFKKKTGEKKYRTLLFGDSETLENLAESIKKKLGCFDIKPEGGMYDALQKT